MNSVDPKATMPLVHQSLRRLAFACLVALGNTLTAQAEEPEFIPVTFSFGDYSKDELVAFITVNGEIAGTVPGTVEVPWQDTPVPVEIGVPQLKAPLYSLLLGASEFKSLKATVVTTNFSQKKEPTANFWDRLLIEPNSSTQVELRELDDGSYMVDLSPKPYDEFATYLQNQGIKPYGQDWFGAIPKANYATAPSDVRHSVFDKITHEPVTYVPGGKEAWSAAYPDALISKTGFGLPLPQQIWLVRSHPEGADVLTDIGWQGQTNIELEMKITGETFLVLKKPGYLDCPDKQCKRTDLGSKIEYECFLKPQSKSKKKK